MKCLGEAGSCASRPPFRLRVSGVAFPGEHPLDDLQHRPGRVGLREKIDAGCEDQIRSGKVRAVTAREDDGERGRFMMERVNALTALGRLGDAGAQIDRAFAMVSQAGGGFLESARVIRRRYLVAVGKGDDALQDFRDHPPKVRSHPAPCQRRPLVPLALASTHRV